MKPRYYVEVDFHPEGPPEKVRGCNVEADEADGTYEAAKVALRVQCANEGPVSDGDEFEVVVVQEGAGTMVEYHARAKVSVDFELFDCRVVEIGEEEES